MTAPTGFSVELPGWVDGFVSGWKGGFDTVERCMELAVALSRENVARDSGGPFGAVVANLDEGRLIGVGVNTVTGSGLSLAHAEMVAVSVAQAAQGTWNLRRAGAVVLLATSCEPCAMCYGAAPWSGVSMLAWGARREDAESFLANWFLTGQGEEKERQAAGRAREFVAWAIERSYLLRPPPGPRARPHAGCSRRAGQQLGLVARDGASGL